MKNKKVTKMKVAKKIAKKVILGPLKFASKVAIAPIVGSLPGKYKCEIYGTNKETLKLNLKDKYDFDLMPQLYNHDINLDDREINLEFYNTPSRLSTHLSTAISYIGGPVLGGYLAESYASNHTDFWPYLALAGAGGALLGLIGGAINEIPRWLGEVELKTNNGGTIIEEDVSTYYKSGSLIGNTLAKTYELTKNFYKQSVDEVVKEEESRLEKITNLESEVEKTIKFAESELLKFERKEKRK